MPRRRARPSGAFFSRQDAGNEHRAFSWLRRLLRSEQVNAKVLVQVEGTLIARYLPPVGVARRGFVSNQPLRRVYDFARGTVDDAGEICQWADRKLTPMIEELIEDRLRNDLETMLEE